MEVEFDEENVIIPENSYECKLNKKKVGLCLHFFLFLIRFGSSS